MKITLKDGDDTLVLERGSDNPDEAAYRDRTMTLNGKVIATGAVEEAITEKAEQKNICFHGSGILRLVMK